MDYDPLNPDAEDPDIRRQRLKPRLFRVTESIREDVRRGMDVKGREELHKFYRMEMPYADALAVQEKFREKLRQDTLGNEVKIRNLNHETDLEKFTELYNAIFLAAPDPSRSLTLEEAKSFEEESTFVALLGSTFAGFIYLTIDHAFTDPKALAGAIAGIGVLARYRGKKIGIRLLNHAIDYFKDKGVEYLICEVYEKNEPSRRMFEGMGMKIVGYMILEEEEGVVESGLHDPDK